MRSPVTVYSRGFALAALLLPFAGALAQIDRHPELKSRAVAWTEFDGSYLVDTNSRAEMLDFFWTVFNRPYPAAGWTGSVNPPVAGTTSELWRIREYAQLNAYRALNGSPAMAEDPSKLAYVQAGALLLAQNPDKPFGHKTDPSWIGYNATAAEALQKSELATGAGTIGLTGIADAFVSDDGESNASWVGHRTSLLHDNTVLGALGAALNNDGNTICAWYPVLALQAAPMEQFIAYPSPGFAPLGFFRGVPQFRWSFVPTNDWSAFCVASYPDFFTTVPGLPKKDATVTAVVNGHTVPVHNLVRNGPPGPLTWDFEPAYLDLQSNSVADGTTVEVTIHNVAEQYPDPAVPPTVIGYHEYRYTITFFDENKITVASPSPRTSLVNLSTRSTIGSGEQQLIAGFSVSGVAPVRVAVRTQGPGLAKFGIPNPSQSTRIKVYDSANHLLGENAGWKQHPNWRLLQGLGVAPSDDHEAAMVLTLWPGTYTAVVSDDMGANGVGIVEGFAIDNLSETELVNLSTRGVVGTGDAPMIAGITLNQSRTIVVRTQGPGLARYGISNPVSDTELAVVAQADGRTIATNDDWQLGSSNDRLRTDLAPLAPSDPHDSALVLTLPAGAYTALVRSKGAPGIGIVEVFDLGE